MSDPFIDVNEETQVPFLSDEEKLAIAKNTYHIDEGDFVHLSGYEDINFRIKNVVFKHKASDIHDVVIKISNPIEARNQEHLDLQNEMYRVLNANGIPAPVLIPTIHGTLTGSVTINSKQFPIRMFETLPGSVLEDHEINDDFLSDLGKLMAEFHNICDENDWKTTHLPFISPDNFQCFYREIDILMKNGNLPEDKGSLAQNAIKNYENKVFFEKNKLDIGLIHSDFNETNILVSSPHSYELKISGLLDFGDVHVSARNCDIGACILYMHLSYPNISFEHITSHFLNGYKEKRLKEYKEEHLLYTCISARLACSLIYGLRTNRLSTRTDNSDYILKTQSNGWRVLKEIQNNEYEKLLRERHEFLHRALAVVIMRTAIWNFCLLLLVTYAFANEVYMYDQSNLFQSFLRIKRDAPVARPLGYYSEVRRSPSNFLRAIGPLAFGHKIGDDTKLPINGLGLLGAGDSEQIVAKFIPEGSENEPFNGGTYSLSDTPNMGYMTRETATGEQSGSSAKASIAGLGTIKVSDVREQGTGLLDFSKKILPFLELPKLKSDQDGDRENTDVDERIGDYFYIKENNNNQNYEPISESAFKPATPFKEVQELLNMANGKNGGGQNRPQPRMLAAKTVEDGDLLDENKKQSSDQEGFIEEETKEESEPDSPFTNSESKTPIKQKVQTFTGRVPIKQLGLSKKEIYDLCLKFSKVAAQQNIFSPFPVCYGPKIPEALVAKCQGYNEDCGEFQAQAKPLGAVANAFSSGVGLTYYDWGVNGIPYYPVNEEGGVGNGHHGKIDFGSWGGGYSNNLGVRDFWSQTGEYGANWYEGTYGYKTGWSVPIGQSLGVEGGAGTQVHVPLKEGELGKPIQVTNGYHVGPFIGLADRVGVDWYNGGISFNKGMAVPLIGVNVNSGTSIGFPSMGHIMNRMGLNGIEYMNDVVSDSSTTLNTQMSEKLGLS